jgi:hypothetical protein
MKAEVVVTRYMRQRREVDRLQRKMARIVERRKAAQARKAGLITTCNQSVERPRR